MTNTPRTHLTPQAIAQLAWEHRMRIIIPTVICTVLALGYALVKPKLWSATQTLIVRDQAAGKEQPGRFQAVDEMKLSQETILELVKSRGVLDLTLREVGPPENRTSSAPYPTEREIMTLGTRVELSAPKGLEFGKSEVFHLQVEDTSSARAVKLVEALCKQLQTRFQLVRSTKATSTVREVTGAAKLAREQLLKTTAQLSKIEKQVGPDLAELRLLQDSPSADSAMRRTIGEMENERRAAQAAGQANDELLAALTKAQRDPSHLLATPNRLLESQPGLRRLKEGLIDAELKLAQLSGLMGDAHPKVKEAKNAVQEIRAQIRSELGVAMQGVQIERRLSQERIATLNNQISADNARLQAIAAQRATYADLIAESRHRTEILKAAEEKLADANAGQDAAKTVSLISLIDKPVAGDDPVGPGRTVIVAGGFFAGLMIGLAGLFLAIPFGGHPRAMQPTVTTPADVNHAHHIYTPTQLAEPAVKRAPQSAGQPTPKQQPTMATAKKSKPPREAVPVAAAAPVAAVVETAQVKPTSKAEPQVVASTAAAAIPVIAPTVPTLADVLQDPPTPLADGSPPLSLGQALNRLCPTATNS